MIPWQRTAAWILLMLSAHGAVLPPLILFLLKPRVVVHVTSEIKSQLPLDTFFLLDASSSVKPPDWALALDFVHDMVARLNASFPDFRAGLGQFSSHYRLESNLTDDIGPFFERLRHVQQLNGTTFMDKALCGHRGDGDDEGDGGDPCPGGALADLRSAAPAPGPGPLDGRQTPCSAQERAARIILLVTDGVPTDGRAAMESAIHLKRGTNVTLMGVLVGGHTAHAQTLYALTSCCNPEEMHLAQGQPRCQNPNWTCPHMVRSTNFSDLVQSSEWLAKTLSASMECTKVEERWNTHADLRSLWFLTLSVPMLLHLLSLRLFACLRLLCSPRPRPGARNPTRRPGPEEPEVRVETPATALSKSQDNLLALPLSALEDSLVDTELAGAGGSTLVGRAGNGPGGASPSGGPKGKRWAPVRTAYIVGGQRLDVNYGGSSPPMAPNAARRGDERESIRDTPEQYFANHHTKGSLLTLSLLGTLTEPVGGDPQQQLVHPFCRFLILLPLLCTLLLLPLVVLWSGALELPGTWLARLGHPYTLPNHGG